jgi:hypothetical protein
MKLRNPSLLAVLAAAAFLIALSVRMVNLSAAPLSSPEAELALQAMASARGDDTLIGPHPAYLALTTVVMFLFGPGDAAARFWPALAGALLTLTPLLFRRFLGGLPAVLLALYLAIDPLLLGISRQAGSLPLGIFFTLLACGLWLHPARGPFRYAAGAAAGVALLCGPGLWPGVISLLAAFAVTSGLFQPELPLPDSEIERDNGYSAGTGMSPELRGMLIAGLAAFFLIGTLFFTIPEGMSAAAASIPVYVSGWLGLVTTPLSLMVLALLLYAFLPLVFGLWGAVRGLLRSDPVDRFLAVWWVVALVLALAYPARAVADLSWALLPLAALAARQLARLMEIPSLDRLPVAGQAVLTAVILSYLLLTAAGISSAGIVSREVMLRLGGAGVLLLLTAVLVGWGWSSQVAVRGFVLGTAAVLLVLTVSAAWDSAGHSGSAGSEIWSVDRPPASVRLLRSTIDDLNQWGPKESGGLQIVVIENHSPALRWQLRGYNHVSFVDQLPSTASPALVITPDRPALELGATYRGQGFLLRSDPVWQVFQPLDWFRWFFFRSVPSVAEVQDRVILWARLDVFPPEDVPPAQSPAPDVEAPQPEAGDPSAE